MNIWGEKIESFWKKFHLFGILFLVFTYSAYSYEPCDSSALRYCALRALTMDLPFGKGAHYVDVAQSQALKDISTEMTLELWIKPVRQPGKIQFIAGLWGPGRDKNDAWALYINQNDSLVFEINGPDTELGREDNTFAVTYADSIYDKWHHLAAVFDGKNQTASIYIDTRLVATARNDSFPVSRLKALQRNDLPIQIGSCNALSDNINLFRTFMGQMDEIRIWSHALDVDEIYCKRLKMMWNPEPNLALYWRCNEHEWQYNLCDASGNNSWGYARSGARCTTSDRKRIQTFFITTQTPYDIVDTLKCDTTWSIKFTVVDTSQCGNRVWFYFRDDQVSNYTTNPQHPSNNQLVLTAYDSVEFTVTLNSAFLNSIRTRFWVVRTNECDLSQGKRFTLTRITELRYSRPIIDFDTIKANCVINEDIDSIITIWNNTSTIGTNRRMTITDIRTNPTGPFSVVVDSTYPIYLDPGESVDIAVRFNSNVNPGQYYDTLQVISDDMCKASGQIYLKGVATEIIAIKNRAGTAMIDTIDFGTTCVYIPSTAREYLWENLISEDIYVDTIIMPEHFISKPFQFPALLEPLTGYMPNYFRFMPTANGYFQDSIIFVTRANGCIVNKTIYVRGRGFKADVQFTTPSLDFSNVKVGQETTMNVTVENFCDEALSISFYLKDGTAFALTGTKAFSLNPGQTRSLPVTFIPISDMLYNDTLCLFERRCYTSSCIPLQGQGYIERFRYEPEVMRTENVIGCQSRLDTLAIYNESVVRLSLENFVLDNQPTQKYSVIYPETLTGYSRDLDPGDSVRFIFRFTPNDVLIELAEKAYLRYETSPDGQEWHAKLLGTSIIPKIFITFETLYDEVEVGDRKRDTVQIINNSTVPIKVDSIITSEGFELIYPDSIVNRYLPPRDSIQAIIDFVPDREKEFIGYISVYASEPCEVDDSGWLLGEGIIIPLEIPMSVVSYGFVRPCDCVERRLNIINQSLVFPRTIDSVWIDTAGIPFSNPDFFTWRSSNSPLGQVPYNIQPMSFDTLYIKFCPRTPARRNYVDVAANLYVKGSGSGWEGEVFDTYLTGKRQLVMEPVPKFGLFPPTRVDTFSNEPQYIYITIPGLDVNPIRDSVVIDSITFVPDDRVFSASDSLGRPFPIMIDSSAAIPIRIDFKPRAVRSYVARMNLHISKPCLDLDTTVLVYGESFAPAYGLDFNFDNFTSTPDTFRVNYCDTLVVKVYSSRDFPADVVDIECGLIYDTTKLEYVSSESPYLSEMCDPHVPYIDTSGFEVDGTRFLLKNFCRVDSTRPFLIAKFLPKTADRDTFSIEIDSLFFDTEEVILFQIVAQVDRGVVIILKPEMRILNTIAFDSVQVLDCRTDTLLIENIGDVPISLDLPGNLPADVEVIGSIPLMGELFNPGDTAYIFLEFCPESKQGINRDVSGESLIPCYLSEPTNLTGISWVPQMDLNFGILSISPIADNIEVTLGDTVLIPILIDKDLSTYLRGVEYWLKDMNFNFKLSYNPYALKYIDAYPAIDADFDIDVKPGDISIYFRDADTIRAGKIADVKFQVTIPDSVITSFSTFADTNDFNSDWIYFLEIIPSGSEITVKTNGKCNITYLNYSSDRASLMQNSPNPWSSQTRIDFTLAESAPLSLRIYSVTGEMILELIDGNESYKSGQYSVYLDAGQLESGVYYYVLESGVYRESKPMVLVK
ncbi:LamG-like jellyroll fold domain-containing protein [Bacteroidota bacterium]